MQDLKQFILSALAEDIGNGDFTTLSTVPVENTGEAICWVKEDCMLAGVDVS